MTTRRDQTTSFIRDAAVRELVERGHSLLTMESVAQRSYSSVGSVYARYMNRSHLLGDVLESGILPVLRDLPDHGTGNLTAVLRRIFGDPALSTHVHALVEVALASRLDLSLRDGVLEGVGLLRQALQVECEDESLAEGITRELAATVLGHFVMSGAGCSVPPLAAELATLVDLMCGGGTRADRPERPPVSGLNVVLPPVPGWDAKDEISVSLTDSAAEALAESGLVGAKLREIARTAGVTTGAVYRRYGSKNELINDVLVRELNNDKYGWTGEFVEALVSDPTAHMAASSMARAVKAVVDDPLRLLAGIEMMQAARADETVRHTVATQVHAAAHARARMVEELVNAGVAGPTTNPELVGWLMQLTPAGERVLTMLGLTVDETVLTRTLQAYLRVIA